MVKSMCISCKLGKNGNKPYRCLTVDFGYTTQDFFLDDSAYLLMADCLPSKLYEMKDGDSLPVEVGDKV